MKEDLYLLITFLVSLIVCVILLIFNITTENYIMALCVTIVSVIIILYYAKDYFKVKIQIVEDLDDIKEEQIRQFVTKALQAELNLILAKIVDMIVQLKETEETKIICQVNEKYLFYITGIKENKQMNEVEYFIKKINSSEDMDIMDSEGNVKLEEMMTVQDFVELIMVSTNSSEYVDDLVKIYDELAEEVNGLEDND